MWQTIYIKFEHELKYLSPIEMYAPRTMNISNTQVVEHARRNKNAIEPLFDEFVEKPTNVLDINDITYYLHLGKTKRITSCMRLTETFLASTYFGVELEEQ